MVTLTQQWFDDKVERAYQVDEASVQIAPAVYLMAHEGMMLMLVRASIRGHGRVWIAVEIITGQVLYEHQFKQGLMEKVINAEQD